MDIYKDIAAAVEKGDGDLVRSLTETALAQKSSAEDILNKALVSGMNVIGEKFKNMEVFIPEVLVSARAMNAGMEILKPLLIKANVKFKGKVVIGTVKGDLHDIGPQVHVMEGQSLARRMEKRPKGLNPKKSPLWERPRK